MNLSFHTLLIKLNFKIFSLFGLAADFVGRSIIWAGTCLLLVCIYYFKKSKIFIILKVYQRIHVLAKIFYLHFCFLASNFLQLLLADRYFCVCSCFSNNLNKKTKINFLHSIEKNDQCISLLIGACRLNAYF